MVETILTIPDMVCGLCEAHIDGLIRNHFTIRKVKSNRRKNETRIVSEHRLDCHALALLIQSDGYRVTNIEEKTFEDKGLFRFRS